MDSWEPRLRGLEFEPQRTWQNSTALDYLSAQICVYLRRVSLRQKQMPSAQMVMFAGEGLSMLEEKEMIPVDLGHDKVGIANILGACEASHPTGASLAKRT
jgi:hypothetical protein